MYIGDWSSDVFSSDLAVTATPLSVSEPLAGSVAILTASSVFAGVSFVSEKPKSAAAKVYEIGRASCRERVEVAGGAGTLVKKRARGVGAVVRSTQPGA